MCSRDYRCRPWVSSIAGPKIDRPESCERSRLGFGRASGSDMAMKPSWNVQTRPAGFVSEKSASRPTSEPKTQHDVGHRALCARLTDEVRLLDGRAAHVQAPNRHPLASYPQDTPNAKQPPCCGGSPRSDLRTETIRTWTSPPESSMPEFVWTADDPCLRCRVGCHPPCSIGVFVHRLGRHEHA